MDRTIYLVGAPASGKTTLGRALHQSTGIPFVDLDEYIEADKGMSVSDIFAREGESAFRAMETAALERLGSSAGGYIIACGGGTPCHGSNMALMNRLGLTVWLQASPERLALRLALARNQRPLVASLADDELAGYVERMLAARTPYYSQAALTFSSERLEDAAQIAQSVEAFRRLTGI